MMNYPNGKQVKIEKQENNYANRGMDFEDAVNKSNEYYLSHDKAVIYKKPTPIRIVEVDYPSRDKAMITKAFYTVPSTTDYNGIYKGKYIDFETKEIHSKTSMPLQVVHEHQITHLERVDRHGAVSFLLVYFKTLGEIYLLETKYLIAFSNRQKQGGRKSISINEFREFGYLVKQGYAPEVDYLTVVDKVFNL